MKRLLSLILALVMLIGLMPQFTLPARAEEAKTITNELEGKTISILGASISTYQGASNGAAADTTNSTIRNNVKYYPNTTIPEVTLNDTWWMQVAEDLGLRLLVNNAWSGSAILLERSGTVGAYVDRCVQLHDDTGDNAGEEPDIICIQMGFNDFSYGKNTLGTSDIDYDTLITADGYGTPATTMEATAIMLDKITKRYPNAEVYMFNHFKRIGQSASDTTLMVELNASIANVAARFDVTVVDLYTALTNPEHIGDGRLHPNRLGMDTISEAVKQAIIDNTAYAVDTHTVSMELNGVTADYVDDKIVVSGGAFSVDLIAADEMKVTITMGGKDITDSAYADGIVTIDAVTADVTIIAENIHTPKDYRWEFDGSDLACVSGDNALTKNAGTTADGVFSKTRYALVKEVVLLHELPWAVEWKCEGTFLNTNGSSGARVFTSDDVNANYNARYIFKSNTNGIIAMGEKTTSGSHNYGIALGDYGIDWTALHTYRLENRISDDGSNMIYLLVDGVEIGPMNHYYIGTKDQNTTSDWLSGKDFVFPYMGTDTHGFTNASIDYIQVTECVHTYEKGTCTGCGAEHPSLANYEGKVISILGDSISTFAGYIPTADGFNLEHYARYPQDNLLTDVNETWWMQVLTELDAKLGINESWRSTEVGNIYDVEVNSGYEGTKACMASITRIQNLGANGTPDVILFYGGTNDITQRRTVGTFDPVSAPSEADLTSEKWNTVADAYVAAILRMQHYYPDAQIIAMLPTFTYKNTDAVIEEYNSVFAAICEHYGVLCIDLRECGISTADLPDGTHPDANGMDYITAAVLEVLLDECDMKTGENVVHSVTHNLTGAESSLGYYKGVSQGKAFVTTITGENVTVTVTMGGEDITASAYADGVVNIPSVTGDIVITAKGREKTVYEDHLQQLPNSICQGTNLWTALEPENIYYTSTGWGNLSGKQAWSITIPVAPGDMIFATSFQAYGVNGNITSSSSGIRVTFFDINGVVKTMTPAETYAEFAANGGYLIVPEGAIAVNIPLWNDSDDNEIYILNRDHNYTSVVAAPTCTEQGYTTHTCANCGNSYVDSYVNATGHSYENGTCTACGTEHPNLANYEGKVISILSASTSTFAGYIPVADGFNLEHRPRYPQDNLLTDVNETWWMQVINELNAKLGINDSWAGSTVSNFQDTNSGDLGPDAAMASLTRIQNLGTNGTPDVILFYGGGNDMGRGVTLGSFDPAAAPTEVDLTATKWDSFADAYVAAIMRLQYFYPNTEIVVIMSHEMPSYVTAAKLDQYGPVMKAICDHYGVKYVDLRDCGITFDMLPDNVHPNAEGMDYITADVLDTLLNRVDLESGENVVYPVYHNLTNAGASLHYYKGVSAGETFVETISGENVTVTVTLGGVDVTAQVYANGDINIPSVTGELVITVKGTFDADGHLQQLPDDVCTGINLWTALSPENIYYTATGWGNTSAGTTWSITFPVTPGERIWATSLGSTPANGSTANGVRITWFDENGVMATLDRNTVYQEFAQYGYITVPEGAVALNLPMTGNQPHYAVYILSAEHNFVDDICTICGSEHTNLELEGHLQQLPDDICAETNLWTVLTPENIYYLGAEWGLYTNAPNVHSVTIPVTPGDKLWATSFGSASGDKTGNGTRITWFDENGVLESVSRDVVYKEFLQNGYITVPEGAIAVNIPMPTGADTWELYILNREHSYEPVVTDPTCTEPGYTTHTCGICGNKYIDSYVPATGHSYGAWYTVTEATCTNDGVKRHDCENCDHYETEVIAAIGHNYTSVVTAPTCTEQGYTTYTCECGDSYVDAYVDATGHSHVVTDSQNATCEEDGYVTYTCHCGDSYIEVIAAVGHSYVDDECEYCGEADPDAVVVLMGDANGDGIVNYLDAMLVAQYYVAEVSADQLDLSAADVNADGVINYLDAMMIAQYYVGELEEFPAKP